MMTDVSCLSWMWVMFTSMYLISPHEGLTNGEKSSTAPSTTVRDLLFRQLPPSQTAPENLRSRIRCGKPGAPKFGKVNPEKREYNVGENVSYTCQTGYIAFSVEKRTCLENGVWSGKHPLCDAPLDLSNMFVQTTTDNSGYDRRALDRNKQSCTTIYDRSRRWWRLDFKTNYFVKAIIVTFSKNTFGWRNVGYMNVKVSTVVVQNARPIYNFCGNFSGMPTDVSQMFLCPNYGIRSRAVFIEDDGSNPYVSVCEVDIYVTLENYDCGNPDSLINGDVRVWNHNKTANYSCKSGFYLAQGDYVRRCTPSGYWSGKQPICVEETQCPTIKTITSGTVDLRKTGERNNPVVGTVAEFRCQVGYRLNGSFELVCLASGKWSNVTPTCELIQCPPIRNLPHRVVKFSSQSSSLKVGTAAKFSCKDGYRLNGRAELVCRSNGSWNDTIPTCQSMYTGEIKDPQKSGFPLVPVLIVSLSILVIVLLAIICVLVCRRKLQERKSTNNVQHPESHGNKETPRESNIRDDVYVNEAMYAHVRPTVTSNKMGFSNKSYSQNVMKDPGVGHQAEWNPASDVEYAVIDNPMLNRSPSERETKQPIYGHVTNEVPKESRYKLALGGLFSKKKKHEKKPLQSTPLDSSNILALYAKVNLEAKHNLRMKNQMDKCNSNLESKPNGIYNDLDTEPVQLRELPPIPSDSDSLYSTKSRNGPSHSVTQDVMYDNDLYSSGDGLSKPENREDSVMVDNTLYSSNYKPIPLKRHKLPR